MAPRHTPTSLGSIIAQRLMPIIDSEATYGKVRELTTLLAAEILEEEPGTAITDATLRAAGAAGFQRGDSMSFDTSPDPWTGKRVRLSHPNAQRLGSVMEVKLEECGTLADPRQRAHSIGVQWSGSLPVEWYSPSELVVVGDA